MPPTSGLRERKKRDRRRRIEDVAIDLFVRQGFDATTIEQIAAAADIAPRTFFSYFATKDDLVLADYTDRLDRILAELERRPDHEPAWDALSASFAAVASDYTTEVDDFEPFHHHGDRTVGVRPQPAAPGGVGADAQRAPHGTARGAAGRPHPPPAGCGSARRDASVAPALAHRRSVSSAAGARRTSLR